VFMQAGYTAAKQDWLGVQSAQSMCIFQAQGDLAPTQIRISQTHNLHVYYSSSASCLLCTLCSQLCSRLCLLSDSLISACHRWTSTTGMLQAQCMAYMSYDLAQPVQLQNATWVCASVRIACGSCCWCSRGAPVYRSAAEARGAGVALLCYIADWA